jgi:hypothetical protein
MEIFLQDDRVQWLRQKTTLALDISIDCFNEYFMETLERARKAGIAREKVLEFFSDKCGAGSTLFFSARAWTESIEGSFFLMF